MADKQYRFTRASRKHRIGREHVRHVLANVVPTGRASPLGDVTEYVWIGPDDRGVELEIVALDLPEYYLVVHVMPTHYRD